MHHHERGLVGARVERRGEPRALIVAEAAGRLMGDVERIEHDPVCAWGFDDRNLAAGERRSGRTRILERVPEDLAVVMIAERKVRGETRGGHWLEEIAKGGVIACEAVVESAITIDEHALRRNGKGQHFGKGGAQMRSHVHIALYDRGIGVDVRVRE